MAWYQQSGHVIHTATFKDEAEMQRGIAAAERYGWHPQYVTEAAPGANWVWQERAHRARLSAAPAGAAQHSKLVVFMRI